MATQDNRVRINADGKKVVMIRRKRDMSPMTLQTSTTMDAMCRLLFKIKAKDFELLPADCYGNWALYTEYRGLHYYFVVNAYGKFTDKTLYEALKTKHYSYEVIRTNYKIPDIIMTPSECINPNDEINFRLETKHGISGSLGGGKRDEPWNINETSSFSQYGDNYFREEVGKKHYFYSELSKDRLALSDFVKLPPGYYLAIEEGMVLMSEFHAIYYSAPEVLSITEKEYNDTVNMIFTKAQQKRNNDYMELVRKISPLNDNCIESILQYVF